MKSFFFRLALMAWPILLAAPFLAPAAQTSCVIEVRGVDSGFYDRYGNHDAREQAGLAGMTATWNGRNPYRSFVAFHIPAYPGTLTQAELVSPGYFISPSGPETFTFREVATPVDVLRKGGFGATNVLGDLADGFSYATAVFNSGYFYSTLPLNNNALFAISLARGQDFAMGGVLSTLNTDPHYNDFVDLPLNTPQELMLRLTLSVPAEPSIYSQPPGSATFSNASPPRVSVGACGAEPLTYFWVVNGTNYGPQSYPDFYFPDFTPVPQPVFVIVSNSFGTATSIVTQVAYEPARILMPFTNLVTSVGDSVYISPVVLVNGYPASSEWRKNGTILSNQPDMWLQLGSNVQTNDSGDYRLIVSNSLGSVTSAVVHIEVVETRPVFWQHPEGSTNALGSDVYLYALAKGGPPPWLRWYRDGTLLATLSNSVYSIPAISANDAGNYYVVASNSSGVVTSRVAMLGVYLDPPVFTIQPTNQTIYYGGFVQFRAFASGTPTPELRWFHDGVPILTNTSPFLPIYPATTTNAGSYFCVASNASGVATSQVATLTVITVPPILIGPGDANALAGQTLNWYVGLSNPPAILRLVFEQTNVVATLNSQSTLEYFSLANLQTNQSGHYFVIASNQFGVSTSRVATLTVTNARPSVALTVSQTAVVEGSPVTFYAGASGAPLPTLTLYHNGIPVPGGYTSASSTSLEVTWELSSTSLADAGDYTAVASNSAGTATATVHLAVNRAGPLDKWMLRNPIPQGRDLHRLVWAQNQFVAIGDNGALVTSPNGTNWTARNTQTAETLDGIAYGNGRFVVASRDGTGLVLVSTNAELWNSALIRSNAAIYDLTFGSGNFLAVGYDTFSFQPAAFRSTNGTDWSVVTIPPPCCTNYFLTVATFGAGRFLVVDGLLAYSSTDLLTWTNSTTPPLPTSPGPLGAAYVNDRFVVVGYSGYLNSSSDGITWGTSTYNGVNSRNLYGIAYGAGRNVIVASRGKIIVSADNLQSWTAAATPTTDRLEDVIFANNLFVAVGENGTILTSNDGLNWTNQTRGVNYDLDGLGVANGLAIAVGKNGTILTSTDGTTWNYIQAPGIPAELHSVAYGNGKWVAVGDSTNIFTSTNGFNWQAESPIQHTLTNDIPLPFSYLKSVIYASNLWVAVGVAGQIITSPDAITWTPRIGPYAVDLNEVIYANGLFVVVGDGNAQAVIWTSPDAVTWTDHTVYGPGKNARGVTFANGLYTVALNDGIILYGTNAMAGSGTNSSTGSWQYGVTGVEGDGNNLRGVTWSNNLWVAVGNRGIILTSTNAETWRKRSTPTYENLHAVRHINNTFIAIGNEGVILQSAPLVSELFAERKGPSLQLTFSSPFESIFKLQFADNFVPSPPTSPWHELAFITNVVGTVDYTVPLPPSGQRFYRVVGP